MVDVLKKEVDYDFEETVKRVEQACADEGFTVLLTKDVSEIFKQKLGIDYPKYVVVLACNARLAKKALDVARDVGTIMPCSFVVHNSNGKVIVAHTSIMQIAVETGLAPIDKMRDLIKETREKVQAIWNRI